MRRCMLLMLFAALTATPAYAQEEAGAEAEKVYLKPLEITEGKDTTQRITQYDLERINAVNLWEAMSLAPGVSMGQVGQRNDSRFKIRGFDQSQIRVMLDDIPVYIPYDAQEDFARYMVDDLETIEISKGYSSALNGANALGGVVNLRSARPKKEFEFKARYRNYFDSRGEDMARQVMMSAGSKQELFFIKATGSFVEQDFFRISEDFSGSPEYSYSNKRMHQNQSSGKREFSAYRDKKLNIQAGFTPTDDTEIVLGYIAQRSMKEQPPYDGVRRSTERGVPTRNWNWPYWDKDNYSLSFKTSPIDDWYVKGNIYYDTYTNKLEGFSDWTHNAKQWDTVYDDFAYGGRVETGYTFNDVHKLAASMSYRRDSHKRKDRDYDRTTGFVSTPWIITKHMKDDLWTAGLEYTLTPNEHWTFVFGASYVTLKPVTANDNSDEVGILSKGNGHEAFDGQGAVFYNFNENHQVYTTLAHKSRMPTLNERYKVTSEWDSDGNPIANKLPNPGLKPEKALHFEVGYRGTIQNKINIGASIFYSNVTDLIANVRNIRDPYTGKNDAEQNRNISKVSFTGIEVSIDAIPTDWLTVGASVSYIDYSLHRTPASSDPDQRFRYLTALPKAKANAYAVITPLEGLSLIPRVEYVAESYYASDRSGNDSRNPKTESFALAHFKATYDFLDHFTVEAGVDNLFDTHYEWEEGYSMPGRTFYAGVKVEF